MDRHQAFVPPLDEGVAKGPDRNRVVPSGRGIDGELAHTVNVATPAVPRRHPTPSRRRKGSTALELRAVGSRNPSVSAKGAPSWAASTPPALSTVHSHVRSSREVRKLPNLPTELPGHMIHCYRLIRALGADEPRETFAARATLVSPVWLLTTRGQQYALCS